ncbi:hypothetical protein OPS25_15570 [Alteromonas ponticola]|uniref:Uncharacterized protein n=1 Tax=Alteromonas aquimaris TaxID=2998417 RepID=A0ABT3PB36_9ALTE|nr:hypothetical protein [Alteromonas aquimaris]
MKNVFNKLTVVLFCLVTSLMASSAVATESGTTADKPPHSGTTNGSSGPCREFPLCSSKYE